MINASENKLKNHKVDYENMFKYN